ncbi:hypothetical protein FS837_012797 [Tulasnella sp. UAMH 9824]|nr:hypothetical protein FS837_012797 [Tulasnella sp. UAMH 9824]
MNIRAGKFTAAVKAATASIQAVFAPPISMTGFYAPPPPLPILNLDRIPVLRVQYDSGTLEKAERPEWENVDEEILEKVSVLAHDSLRYTAADDSKYDITRLRVDAIVNAADSSLLGGEGVDGAVHRAAGSGLLEECRKLDGCEVGQAKITGGYRLPATHIIHAVGPIYYKYQTEKEAAQLLRSCYTNSLKLATEKELKTIAFCSISAGGHGYPIEAATKEAMVATRAFLDSNDGVKINRVIFCTFSGSDTEVYRQIAPLYFPTSKEYPAQRDYLPDIPFGMEFYAVSSTPSEDSEALIEDELLVPRTPNRKASERLKKKRVDEDDGSDEGLTENEVLVPPLKQKRMDEDDESESDAALTENEVLVSRTPGGKASMRLTQKRMNDGEEEGTENASRAPDLDTQQGADPVTVAPQQAKDKGFPPTDSMEFSARADYQIPISSSAYHKSNSSNFEQFTYGTTNAGVHLDPSL